MTTTIQQLEDLKEWSQDSTRYERRLAFRGHMPSTEAGTIPVEFDELSDREQEYYRTGPWSTREDYSKGQLVQPGPGRQGYEGNPRKLRIELTADQTVEFRKRVEKLATFNDQPKPNWKEHPNLGYDYDNITEHNMASDAKRNLLKGRKPQELKFLNQADQDLIKSKFTLPENVKEWNFKEYKYGLSQTTPKGENYKLGQSVRNYIVNKHHFNYGFSDFGNRNYHLFQMGRASKKFPKLYEPIYQDKKVIGFIDNTPTGKGEKYYHADYKKGKTILQHPDAKKLGDIRKVIEKANKNFAETADNIFSKHGYKNISEVMDDFQKIKGRSDIPSGIAQHHPFGTKEAGKTVLISRDANAFAENVKREVKSGKITLDQADELLKEKGIPYEIEGKKLGKWDISPQKQLRDWEKGLERKFLSGKKTLQEFPETKNFRSHLNSRLKKTYAENQAQLFKNLGIKINKICSSLVAGGGRIGFAEGKVCGMDLVLANPEEFIKASQQDADFIKVLQKNPQRVKKVASKIARHALHPWSLLGGELWFVGLDTWASRTRGIPLNEALDNAFVFYDFEEGKDNLMNVAADLGYSEDQIHGFNQLLGLAQIAQEIPKQEQVLRGYEQSLKGLTDPSPNISREKLAALAPGVAETGFAEYLSKVQNQRDYISELEQQHQSDWDSYVWNTAKQTGKDVSQVTDEDLDIGFEGLYKTSEKKVREEIIEAGQERYEDKERYVYPGSSDFGEALFTMWPWTSNWDERRRLQKMSEEELKQHNIERGYQSWEDVVGGEPLSPLHMKRLYSRGFGNTYDSLSRLFNPEHMAEGGIASLLKK